MLRLIFQCFALISSAFFGLGHAAEFDDWLTQYVEKRDDIRSYQSGDVAVREIRALPTTARAGLVLTWAEFSISSPTLTVEDVRLYGPSYEIYARQVPKDALGAVNGGFFGYDKGGKQIPLGLVIANRQTKNALMKWTTGGVLLQGDNRKIDITPIKQFRFTASIANALQSKPLLVERGAVAIRAEDARFNRSALCITKKGTIVLAGAFESFGRALTLKEFAGFLAKLKALSGIEIETALAMDGGPGAQLFFPSLSRHYGDPGNNYVPNLVYLKRSAERGQ